MKYLILLFLVVSCSTSKPDIYSKKIYRTPTQKYLQRKLINKKTQLTLSNI